jgi:hypothetical protein
MYHLDRQYLFVRLALLGVLSGLGLFTATASSFDKSSDNHNREHVEVFVGKKSTCSIDTDQLRSGPIYIRQSCRKAKAAFSPKRLRYDQVMASVWHRHYQDIHLAFKCNLLRINSMIKSTYQAEIMQS